MTRPKSFLLEPGGSERVKKKRTHHKKPKAQEEKVAGVLGGRKQAGSGSQVGSRGDVMSGDGDLRLLVECKRSSGKRSIRVEAKWLVKISDEARANNAIPALDLQFDDEVMREVAGEMGRVEPETDWIAIPLKQLRYLLELAGVDFE